jgi:hypothetical protein
MINLFDNRQLFFKGIEYTNLAIQHPDELTDLISELHKIKNKNPSLLTPTHSALEYAKDYVRDRVMESVPCVSGYLCIYIDAHANVRSGCWVLPPLGNLRQKRLREIVFSTEYRERIRTMFCKKCPGCGCGYVANLWFNLPSTIEEISWYIKRITN